MFTQYRQILLLLCLLVLCAACNRQSGTYIVYNVTPFDPAVTWMPAGYNDSISNELKNTYSGKRLDLEYTDKYVKLKSSASGKDLVMTKVDNPELGVCYFEQHTEGPVTTNLTLRHHKENLVLIISKSVQQPKPPGYPKSPFDFSWKPTLTGLVICYLNKE
ncbi:hypothetical protein [Mucilaginibacter limnophilus]|nr:hypothetical protein [Mucilaginibacter limnophilus]